MATRVTTASAAITQGSAITTVGNRRFAPSEQSTTFLDWNQAMIEECEGPERYDC